MKDLFFWRNAQHIIEWVRSKYLICWNPTAIYVYHVIKKLSSDAAGSEERLAISTTKIYNARPAVIVCSQ